MGCKQSKATDQIIHTGSANSAVAEARTTDVSAPGFTVEAASGDHTSSIVPDAEQQDPTLTQDAPVSEETSTTVEPANGVETTVSEEHTVSETTPDTENSTDEAMPTIPKSKNEPEGDVEHEVSEPGSVKEASNEELNNSQAELPVETEATHVNSRPADEHESHNVEAVTNVQKDEIPEQQPKSELPAEVKPADGLLKFTAGEVTFNDKGITFYNFSGSDPSNPANDVHLSKRYSEFKTLMQQLLDNQEDKVSDLPALPKTSLLQGRKNPKMLEDRKTQFVILLNAMAAHPVVSQSAVFKNFLS